MTEEMNARKVKIHFTGAAFRILTNERPEMQIESEKNANRVDFLLSFEFLNLFENHFAFASEIVDFFLILFYFVLFLGQLL